jgi:hypothetical protein
MIFPDPARIPAFWEYFSAGSKGSGTVFDYFVAKAIAGGIGLTGISSPWNCF